MEFGKHIGKGLWGLAGRALPSVYGLGIIVFVIRVFLPVEFGVYTLLQTVLLLAMGTAQTFALQPLVKFGAETDEVSVPVTASAALYAAFIVPVALLLLAAGGPFGEAFRSAEAGGLLWYVAAILVVTIPRNIASYLLQSKLELRVLFLLDAVYYIGSLVMIAWLVPAGALGTAEGVMQVNLLTAALSSVYGAYLLARRYRVRFEWSRPMLASMWEYGRFSLGASASYTLYSQSDNLVISAMMGPIPLAVYNAAKVFARAYDLILQTINTLLVPVVSRAHSRGDLAGLTSLAEKSLFFFTVGTAGVSAAFLLLGGPLLSLVYGGKYADAVPVLSILAAAGVFIPGIAVAASFCHGTAVMKPLFRLNLLTAVLGIGLIALLTGPYGIHGTAWAVLATFAVVSPLWIHVLVRRTGVPVSAAGVVGRYGDISAFVRGKLRRG